MVSIRIYEFHDGDNFKANFFFELPKLGNNLFNVRKAVEAIIVRFLGGSAYMISLEAYSRKKDIEGRFFSKTNPLIIFHELQPCKYCGVYELQDYMRTYGMNK